ncbi:membrane dipeptidase [Halobacteria archaeon AArc-curdl1]|uniref:Membrane dipeptidase n=1 Tax=Natronosalvus hydrolyticus TaxID=2979988 RepID=A0AAP2Z6C3_9EURY|nr:membrane dipeptidase [Halobacteria archaeon AArc-curdl1]
MRETYDGYEPFDYLDDDEYTQFDFPAPDAIGEPHELELTAEQEQRAEAVREAYPVISLHEHPFYFPDDVSETLQYVSQGRTETAYGALAESPLTAIFDNMLDGLAAVTSKSGWKFRDIVYDLGMRLCDLEHQDFVVPARSVDDIHAAHETGRIAMIPTIESSMPIENELDRIDILFGLGIRMMGLTYSESNALGSGLKEKRDAGLTVFGEQAVERMNKVGMAIDASHASNQSTLDACEISESPIFLSHNGAYELLDDDRLDPDHVLEAVADTGGVIGIQAAPHNTATLENNPRHTIDAVIEHFEYVRDLVGIDHVTFGPDTLYGDHVGLHDLFFAELRNELERVEYVEGMENPTEAWNNIVRYLVREEYTDEEIEKILGGNVLRALEDVWP